MILNFQPQFVPYVLEGSKTHTIRGLRKDGRIPRAGETCHCYTGLRQKGARLLGRWECIKVETIQIAAVRGIFRMPKLRLPPGVDVVAIVETFDANGSPTPAPLVWIDGQPLSPDELNAFANRDGFRAGGFAEMLEFWKGRLPFSGFVIHWRFS